ncbi:MAG: carbohydrate ABC transporter substrate-binding protein [Geminicoccaceae bacterium]|nr:carbohydrate ABC transporter substrate-binding protein [Geminicoccaceae bacterium]
MLRTRAVALAALCMSVAWAGDGAGLRAADLRIVSSTGHVPLLRRLVDAWAAGREGITAEVRPGPKQISRETEIDLRLSTGGMGDLFTYSAGALFRAIQSRGRLVDLTWLPLQRRVDPAFRAVVSADGRIFGVPLGGASVGGILYNRRLYAELGLTEPESWARFMENNRRIAAAGRIPVMQTYASPWTSQMLVLADYYNVSRSAPDFATDLVARRASFAGTPAALRSFARVEELRRAGFLNADRGELGLEDGLAALADGRAAHYPMHDFGLEVLHDMAPEALETIGFFPVPPDEAGTAGLTLWMPPALYVPKSGNNLMNVLDFLDFVAGPKGCAIVARSVRKIRPLIADCGPHVDVPPALRNLDRYLLDPQRHTFALEFLTPLKGPSLEQICIALGLGVIDAGEAARRYDRDIERRALELGLDGWHPRSGG